MLILVTDDWCYLLWNCHQMNVTDKSTLVQVMAWCCQAISHYLSQCWPRYLSPCGITRPQWVNTLRPRQDSRHFPDDVFKWIFLNANVWIFINISPEFLPKGQIINIPALVQMMAWRRSGDKPSSGSMIIRINGWRTYVSLSLNELIQNLVIFIWLE